MLYGIYRKAIRSHLLRTMPYYIRLPNVDRWFDLPEEVREDLVKAVSGILGKNIER